MGDTKITFDSSSGAMSDTPKGSILRMAGGSFWKKLHIITDIPSATTLTVKWAWWLEAWFQWGSIALVWGSVVAVWW